MLNIVPTETAVGLPARTFWGIPNPLHRWKDQREVRRLQEENFLRELGEIDVLRLHYVSSDGVIHTTYVDMTIEGNLERVLKLKPQRAIFNPSFSTSVQQPDGSFVEEQKDIMDIAPEGNPVLRNYNGDGFIFLTPAPLKDPYASAFRDNIEKRAILLMKEEPRRQETKGDEAEGDLCKKTE